MIRKNVKIDEETWKELSKQKIDLDMRSVSDVIRLNNQVVKKCKDSGGLVLIGLPRQVIEEINKIKDGCTVGEIEALPDLIVKILSKIKDGRK